MEHLVQPCWFSLFLKTSKFIGNQGMISAEILRQIPFLADMDEVSLNSNSNYGTVFLVGTAHPTGEIILIAR